MNNLCIVTAYIDINRDNWEHFQRTTNDYIVGFKPYLNFTEEMIVFIDEKHYSHIQNLINESGKQNILLINITHMINI